MLLQQVLRSTKLWCYVACGWSQHQGLLLKKRLYLFDSLTLIHEVDLFPVIEIVVSLVLEVLSLQLMEHILLLVSVVHDQTSWDNWKDHNSTEVLTSSLRVAP